MFSSDFTQGMILPKKDSTTNASNVTKKPAEPGVKLPVSNSSLDMKKLNIGTKIDTKTFEYAESFKCPPAELYNVLTLPELLRAFTNSPVESDPKAGGKFSMFGGQISGEFVELVVFSNLIYSKLGDFNLKFCYQVANKKISQKWRNKSWPEGHHSLVTFELNDKGDATELSLIQKGVPTR